MLATEALYTSGRAVVLIDADIVGTEASEVLKATAKSDLFICETSVVDVLDRVPDAESVIRWLESGVASDLAAMVAAGTYRRFLIRSFPEGFKEPERRGWRDVLEKSGLYVQRRMRDLVRALREKGLDVVVDLPAFDVGFAKEVRAAIAAEPSSRVFFVTDVDIRSITATIEHFKDPGHVPKEPWLVINRVPKGMKGAKLDFPTTVVTEIELDEPGVGKHTRHKQYGGTSGKGLLGAVARLFASLGDDDQRHLCGEK